MLKSFPNLFNHITGWSEYACDNPGADPGFQVRGGRT